MRKAILTLFATSILAVGALTNDFTHRSPEGPATRRPDSHRPLKASTPGALPKPAATQASPSLYGVMINNDKWGYNKATGVYAINAATGATSLVCATPVLGGNGSAAATYADGNIYASYIEDFFGNISTLKNITIDVATGAVDEYEYPSPTYDDVSINMTYDAATKTIYTINYSGSFDYYDLCTFDPATQSHTVIGPLAEHFYAICSDSRGHLYAINDNGDVVEVSPADGHTVRTVARTNIEPSYMQSACWSPSDGLIYWAACNYTTAALITIDPATGAVATARNFANDEEFVGLYCTDPVEDPAAPAAPSALSVTYPTPGGNSAVFSCLVPSTTIGGSAITGDITLNVSVDGADPISAAATAGSTASVNLTLDGGRHRIDAWCETAAGRGTAANVTTFTGADLPGAPQSPAAIIDADGNVALSWQAPAAGLNGGWYDPESLTYEILCNGLTIARGISATSFTHLIGDELAVRSYVITSCAGGNLCASASPVTLTTGTWLALPYANDFETDNSFTLLSVVDANGDGNSWVHNTDYNLAAYNYSRTSGGDDYLVMPPVNALAGHVYRMAFYTRAVSGYYPDKLEVVAGAEPTAQGLSTILFPARKISNEGENLSVEFEATADGPLYFAFHCVSDPDMSSLFVDDIVISDYGTLAAPARPADLAATAATDGSTAVTLTFTAPSTTLAGASLTAFDAVEILRNGAPIASLTDVHPGQKVQFTDPAAPQGFNTYAVGARLGSLGVNYAETRIFAGRYSLPFAVTPDADEFSLFTGRGNWYHDISENALKITTYGYNPTNDYIFTPAVHFADANLVDLTFDYRAGLASCTEELEVTFGPTPDASTHTAIGRFEFNNIEYARRRLSFRVPGDGTYYIGFHAVSQPQQMMMLVRNIALDRGSVLTAPAAATEIEAHGVDGSLSAKVTVVMPTVDIAGNPLPQSPMSVRLLRADESVADTADGLLPGQSVTITDANAAAGINSWTVIASNNDGAGARATASCWVGVDMPGPVQELSIAPSTDNLEADLWWNAPETAVHDGWLDPDNLSYKIYQLDGNNLYLIQSTTDCTARVRPTSPAQDFYTFYVVASTEAGDSRAVSTGLVLGPPYSLPLIETASNQVITAMPWISGPIEGDANWGVANYIGSIDLTAPDGGMFVCSATLPDRRPGVARMQLPKLCFDGLNAPTLTFKMYHYDAPGASLQVCVTTDDLDYEPVFEANTSNGIRLGWKEYSVNLAKYSDAPWVAITFDATLPGGAPYVIVDDIEVSNMSERDLLITRVTGPVSPEVGAFCEYVVEVKNAGREQMSMRAELSIDGQMIDWKGLNGWITSGKTLTLSLGFTPTAEMLGTAHTVEIEIFPDNGDEIPSNNIASFQINVVQPEKRVITNLTAESTSAGAVLAWDAPSLAPEAFVDNFCDYPSFEFDNFGPYTTHDLDGLIPCGIQGVEFPNMGTPMAFQIWEPKAAGVDVDAEIWQPYSGHKCLIAWTALSSYEDPYNDDWLVSPLLYSGEQAFQPAKSVEQAFQPAKSGEQAFQPAKSGEQAFQPANKPGQTISLRCRRPVSTYGPESFEILWSTGGTDPDDFSLLAQETIADGIWHLLEYQLPAEARRFAIRYVSRDRFALLFDDLTYTPASADSGLSIQGFNIYRNGLKIATADRAANSFVDSAPEAESVYHLTVLYDRGESAPSNLARISSGISDAVSADVVTVSATKDCIRISAPAGAKVIIADAAGRTRSFTMSDTRADIPAAPGIHIVTVDGRAHKVAVP